MTIIPKSSTEPSSVIRGIVGSIPIHVLRIFIVNPFLASTTVFPFIPLMWMTSASFDGSPFRAAYVSTLEFLTTTLFGRSLESATGTDLVGIFFLLILILNLIIVGVGKVFGRFGFHLNVGWKQVAIVMSLIYGLSWLATRGQSGMPEPIFWWLFYLFNMFSIFAYHVTGIALTKLRE